MRLLAALVFLLVSTAASAETWPAKPIRLIVPFPPGGSNDIIGRMISAQLGERLGQPVIIDNRGGAGGTIGTALAAKATPDGYTFLMISVAHAFNVSLYKQLGYDPVTSFAPVGMLGTGPVVLSVWPGLPVHSVKELIDYAKAKPGELHYATAGVGSLQHLASALFMKEAGIDAVHVPYKGGGPATMDVVGGQAEISIGSLIQSLPHIRNGGLRVLGTSGTKRSPALPDVPTIAEAGLPSYEAANWWGFLAPAGTPPEAIQRFNSELGAVLETPETKKRFETEGAEPHAMASDEFGKFVVSEIGKWTGVVKDAGISAE